MSFHKTFLCISLIFLIFFFSESEISAVNYPTSKKINSFDYLSDIAACVVKCPLFDFTCYANCALILLPTPPLLPPAIGNDLIACAESCLNSLDPNCLINCTQNLPANLAQCVIGCGIPPDLDCINNQCINKMPQPPSNPKNPPNNPAKPSPPNQPTVVPTMANLPLSRCVQIRGYCSDNINCINNFEYYGNTYGCPYDGYCCESKNSLPSLTPMPTIPPQPTIDISKGINCSGDYSVTVQGCKRILGIEGCEWHTVPGTETLCVQPSDCNIGTCNNQLALIGPTIAAQEAAKQGAYIKPGTFSGYCKNVQNENTVCSNPIITSSSLNLNNPQDWSLLLHLIESNRISDLEVLRLIHKVVNEGTYTPGLQFKTTN